MRQPGLRYLLLALWAMLVAASVTTAMAADTVIAHGPFEIIASPRRISTGTFPNQGGNPFATTEVTEFRVRWKGKPVKTPGGIDRFWRVLRLEGAPRPALLLVNKEFVLATEEAGELELQALRTESNSLAETQWLDGADGQPAPEQTYGIQRVADLQGGTQLSGGRWLRLGSRLVIDVPTLTLHTVTPWVPIVPGKPVLAVSRDGDTARAFSPGRTQYVLAASGYDYSGSGSDMAYGVLVVDIPTGITYELRFRRKDMRFAAVDDIDAAWIAHHFAWQKDAKGGERLVPRTGFKPWPWRGKLWESSPGRWEYQVPRISERFISVLHGLVAGLPDAKPEPMRDDAFEVAIGACTLRAQAFGRDGSSDDRRVAIWPSSNAGPPTAGCREAVRRVAALADAELASGRHDALLLLDD